MTECQFHNGSVKPLLVAMLSIEMTTWVVLAHTPPWFRILF